jgi:hypothetical protein
MAKKLQAELRGIEKPSIAEVDNAADDYIKSRDKYKALAELRGRHRRHRAREGQSKRCRCRRPLKHAPQREARPTPQHRRTGSRCQFTYA